MPIFNFQKRFVRLVEAGEKRRTIRAPRRDGRPSAKVGDVLTLYTGLRTKACRKLGEAVCLSVARVEIGRNPIGAITVSIDGCMELEREATNVFALQDGFDEPADLAEWIEQTHGLPFEGSLIEWSEILPNRQGEK